MSTLKHKQVKSQKQHLKILWGRGAEKNKYPVVNDIYIFVWNSDQALNSYTLSFVNTNLIPLNIK